jgi:crotonobetainyl-CoA:carnitine CoA-transferase CaiB-like acyl-CoA transferase
MSNKTLEDLTVIEISSAIAGPYTGKLLADNGATVIKVEPIDGALLRNLSTWYDKELDTPDEYTYAFFQYNSGKESFSVDLKSEQGIEILWELVDEADVFLENMRSGALERLGLTWEDMHERNESLIYCSITGYGEDGPYSDWPAFDTAIQGVSGWASQNRHKDRPKTSDVMAIDYSTALHALSGILMAIIERGRSGEGQRIDVSMLDVAIALLGNQLAELSAEQADEQVAQKTFRQSPDSIRRTSDGYLVVLVMPNDWSEFCQFIGKEELATDHRLSTLDGRRAHADELTRELDQVFKERTTEEWITALREELPQVITAPVNTIPDLLEDDHIKEQETIMQKSNSAIGDYFVARPAISFSRTPSEIGDIPALGSDTDLILESLGYEASEINSFKEEDIVK